VNCTPSSTGESAPLSATVGTELLFQILRVDGVPALETVGAPDATDAFAARRARRPIDVRAISQGFALAFVLWGLRNCAVLMNGG
jgi:hypothetical protein